MLQCSNCTLIQQQHTLQLCDMVSFNSLALSDTYASVNYPSFVQLMACRLVGAKPLSETMLSIRPLGTNINAI